MIEDDSALDAGPGPIMGVWPGTVVSVNDPERRGRIRVRVDHWYGVADEGEDEKIEDEELPWAEGCFMPPGLGSGMMWIPTVGSPVWVAFMGGDSSHPVWLGGWYAPADVIPEHSDRLDKTAVMRTPGGHRFEMDWSLEGEERIDLENPRQVAGLRLLNVEDKGRVQLGTVNKRVLLQDDVNGQTRLWNPTVDGQLVQVVNFDAEDGSVEVTNGGGGLFSISNYGAFKLDNRGSMTILQNGDVTRSVQGSVTDTLTGDVTRTITGAVQKQTTGNVITNLIGTLTSTVVGLATIVMAAVVATMAAFTLTVVGAISITAGSIVLSVASGAIVLGSSSGTKRALVMENFIIDVYNGHTHGSLGADPPNPQGNTTDHVTQHLRAD